MELQIVALAKETKKTSQGVNYRGIKGPQWWVNLRGEEAALKLLTKGQTIAISDPKKSANGQLWAILEEKQPPPPPIPEPPQYTPHLPQNGRIRLSWGQFEGLIRYVHDLAVKLEPDTDAAVPDRARARVALMATILIPVLDGKVELPIEDEEAPF